MKFQLKHDQNGEKRWFQVFSLDANRLLSPDQETFPKLNESLTMYYCLK